MFLEMVVSTLQRWARTQKTPEMNELESDKQNLKRWASNFEKQKNRAFLWFFLCWKKKGPTAGEWNEFAL